MDNNLPLQELVTDYFVNLSLANEYRLKLELGSIEQAKLAAGSERAENKLYIYLSFNIAIIYYNQLFKTLVGLMNSLKNEMIDKLNGLSANEITIYSCVIICF